MLIIAFYCCNIRPIYMVVLASAVEGSFDAKRAQCK